MSHMLAHTPHPLPVPVSSGRLPELVAVSVLGGLPAFWAGQPAVAGAESADG